MADRDTSGARAEDATEAHDRCSAPWATQQHLACRPGGTRPATCWASRPGEGCQFWEPEGQTSQLATPPCQEATATGPGRPDGQSSSKPRCSRSRPRGRCRRLLLSQAAGKTPLTVDRTLGRTHVPLDSTPALGSRPDQQPPEQDARQHPRVAISASTGKVLLLPRLKPRRPLRCPRLPSAAAWGPAPVPFPRL